MTRHERLRRKREAEIQARAMILPDASTRRPSEPSRFRSPIADAIEAYRQTPEAWVDVWRDEDPE